jgi:hypothetical protein
MHTTAIVSSAVSASCVLTHVGMAGVWPGQCGCTDTKSFMHSFIHADIL